MKSETDRVRNALWSVSSSVVKTVLRPSPTLLRASLRARWACLLKTTHADLSLSLCSARQGIYPLYSRSARARSLEKPPQAEAKAPRRRDERSDTEGRFGLARIKLGEVGIDSRRNSRQRDNKTRRKLFQSARFSKYICGRTIVEKKRPPPCNHLDIGALRLPTLPRHQPITCLIPS